MPDTVALLLIATLFTFVTTGCSPYLESTPPTPVDVDEYQIGQPRGSVLELLGAPESTVTESDGAICDVYRLALKRNIAAAESAPDAGTWLADHLKNEKHPAEFCYRDGRIVRIKTDTGRSAGSAQAALGAASAVPATSISAPVTSKTPVAASARAAEPAAASARSGPAPSTAAAPLTQVSPGQSSAQPPSTGHPVATP